MSEHVVSRCAESQMQRWAASWKFCRVQESSAGYHVVSEMHEVVDSLTNYYYYLQLRGAHSRCRAHGPISIQEAFFFFFFF